MRGIYFWEHDAERALRWAALGLINKNDEVNKIIGGTVTDCKPISPRVRGRW